MGKVTINALPRADYFEGVLQLRPATQEVLDFLHRFEAEHLRFRVTKETPLAGDNIDLWVSSQRMLVVLAKQLREKFQGTVTISRRIQGYHKETSKARYRVSVLFKPLVLKTGQDFKYRGETYKILMWTKTQVTLQDPRNGKKFRIKIEEVHQ